MKIKEWFQMMTLGQPYKYLRLMLWCLFDSIVMSIPYGLMLGAVYYLLVPLAQPGTELPTTDLWLLVGGFLAQLIAYFFIRQKTYIDASTGYAGIIKDSQITLGEHLRQLSMGFYSARDAGDLSTVLLRDYQTVGDLSQQMLPQVAVILIRFVLAAVLFGWPILRFLTRGHYHRHISFLCRMSSLLIRKRGRYISTALLSMLVGLLPLSGKMALGNPRLFLYCAGF